MRTPKLSGNRRRQTVAARRHQLLAPLRLPRYLLRSAGFLLEGKVSCITW